MPFHTILTPPPFQEKRKNGQERTAIFNIFQILSKNGRESSMIFTFSVIFWAIRSLSDWRHQQYGCPYAHERSVNWEYR